MLHRALKLIRESHGITLTEAANELGFSKSHLSELESGKKTPSLEFIQKYSEHFDIPASSILFFSESLDDNERKFASKTRRFLSKKILDLLERS